jgi:hypothetical protein
MFRLMTRLEPHVTIRGEVIDPNVIPDETLTLDDWEGVRANTPGFEALYPKLCNEALAHVVEHNLKNCFGLGEPGTYPYTLEHILIPLLLKRLRRT